MDLIFCPREPKLLGNVPTLTYPLNATRGCPRLNPFIHRRREGTNLERVGVYLHNDGIWSSGVVLVPAIDFVEIEHNNDGVGITGNIVLPHRRIIIGCVPTQKWSEGRVCVVNHAVDPTIEG